MPADCAETNYTFPPTPTAEPITLRPATLADARGLAVIGSATFLEAYSWVLPTQAILDFCLDHSTPSAYEHYLAEPTTRITLAVTGAPPHPGTPVGFAMVCSPDLAGIELQPGDLELKRIYLLSRFRSASTPVLDAAGNPIPSLRGGQALMEAALASARELRAPRLLLGTNAGNQRAIAFYRRNGYQQVGTRTFQVGPLSCCDAIFARTL